MRDTLTANEAAEQARISGVMLRTHIRLGHLKAIKAETTSGKQGQHPYIIKKEDFEAWIATRKKKG
jgi:hypothetical protein